MSLALLNRALEERRGHLSPFLMLGDPDAELCEHLAVAAVRHGATMLELGIPYDDPCADGPAIQEACLRARRAGMTTDGALALLERLRAKLPDTPFNLLVYANLVHARGWERFCRDAAAAGASSLLCPDVPLEEDEELRAACAAAGLGHVYLVGPLTAPERLAEADRRQSAFLYLAAHQGVTGAEGDPDAAREALVARVAAAAADERGRWILGRTVDRFVDALTPLTRVSASPIPPRTEPC